MWPAVNLLIVVVVLVNCQQLPTNKKSPSSTISIIPSGSIEPTSALATPNLTSSTFLSNGSSITPTSTFPSTTMKLNSTMITTTSVQPTISYNSSTTFHSATVMSLVTTTMNISTATIMPSTATTHIIMSSSVAPTSTPKPKVIIECGDECKSLRKRLYVAAILAILFVIVAIVLGVLLYRQWKISRDRDDHMSRLI